MRYTTSKMIDTDESKISELLNRSIDTIYPSKDFLKAKLSEGKQLKVYVGIDPTADYVHLGHSTNYLVLERFHQLGHKIIVLVGDFTAMIGDPSDKSAARVKLTKEQVAENLQAFKEQIGKILNFDDQENPIEFKFNSEWLSSLTFHDAVELASNFTVQQMIERDAFKKRLSEEKPLYVHEFFYPLMQGYDSVAMDVDIEVGGTDQTFNMLAGRTLLKRYKDKEKAVITTTLLENPVTGEKLMSKSLGTGVGLNESAPDMFGGIMALPDEGIMQCFVDCTRLSIDEIKAIDDELKSGKNPRDVKFQLAHEIVKMYHGDEAADKAKDDWVKQFSERSQGFVPDDVKELRIADVMKYIQEQHYQSIIAAALATTIPESTSEARRLFNQGAYKLNGRKVDNLDVELKPGDTFQIGKRHYFSVTP